MKKLNAKTIAICGILTAMTVVLAEFLGINLPMIQISFNFIPIVFTALYFGPVYCCIVAALADFIGALLFQGNVNPIFTVIAALMGLSYGLWLYSGSPLHKGLTGALGKVFKASPKGETIAFVIVTALGVLFDMVLFTLICTPVTLHHYFNLSYATIYPPRLVKVLVMIPLETAVIYVLRTQLVPRLKKNSFMKFS